MTKLTFYLRHKETEEDLYLDFETSHNPLRMALRLTKMVKKLKKYDKIHHLVNVISKDKNLVKLFKQEINRQKTSIDKTGEVALPKGMPDLTPSGIKKRANEWYRNKKRK